MTRPPYLTNTSLNVSTRPNHHFQADMRNLTLVIALVANSGIWVMTNFYLISVFLTCSYIDFAKCLRFYIISSLFLHQLLYSVPLRTRACYIRAIFVLFLQDYCALQELLMKMNFTLAVAPPFMHAMMSLPATPTHSVRKYGFLSEPTWRRQ